MNFADALFGKLKADQQQLALDALRRPQARDTFEYGYRVGLIAGYDAALEALLSLLHEEKHGDADI